MFEVTSQGIKDIYSLSNKTSSFVQKQNLEATILSGMIALSFLTEQALRICGDFAGSETC